MPDADDDVLMVANSPEQAQVILALLHGEGIDATTDGEALLDEFGVTQRMMGQIGVTIRVAPEDKPRALRLVEQARQAALEAAEEDARESETDAPDDGAGDAD